MDTEIYAYLADYSPPTTSNRKISGLTVWAAANDGTTSYTQDSVSTLSVQKSVVIESGGCGKAGQKVKIDTKGQKVELTIKSPVALAAEQNLLWEEKTGTPVNWQLSASTPANSVKCTCGSTSFTTLLTRVSNTVLKIVLPAKGTDATEVKCAKGSISCVVREWTTGSSSVTDMTASCYVCDKGNGACTSTESAADPGKGVVRYVSSVTFTFDQNEVKSTDVLSVKDVTH